MSSVIVWLPSVTNKSAYTCVSSVIVRVCKWFIVFFTKTLSFRISRSVYRAEAPVIISTIVKTTHKQHDSYIHIHPWYLTLTQFVGNDGLTTTVVGHGELGNHITGIVGSVLHSSTLGAHFRSIAFNHSPVERVGKGEFLKIGQNIILDFVNGKVGYIRKMSITVSSLIHPRSLDYLREFLKTSSE